MNYCNSLSEHAINIFCTLPYLTLIDIISSFCGELFLLTLVKETYLKTEEEVLIFSEEALIFVAVGD